jgi:hypothetical protein
MFSKSAVVPMTADKSDRMLLAVNSCVNTTSSLKPARSWVISVVRPTLSVFLARQRF